MRCRGVKCGDPPDNPPRATPEFWWQYPNGSYQLWERRELGRVWEPFPPPLRSAPVPSRSLFPTLDGAWMTGSALPSGPGAPRSAHPRALPAPPLRAGRAPHLPSSACRSHSAGIHRLYFSIKILKLLYVFFTDLARRYRNVCLLLVCLGSVWFRKESLNK